MSSPQYELMAMDGSRELGRWSLGPGRFTLGQSPSCSIQLEAEEVQAEHAQLSIHDDGSIVLEAGAAGVACEGQPVDGAALVLPGQALTLGGVTLLLRDQRQTQQVSLGPEESDDLPAAFRSGRRYEIERQIAQGGMGAVLQARQSTIRRAVALKVSLPTAELDVGLQLRFIEEAQITGQLEHPNIVPVHDAGLDEDGRVFYTMKLVRGITLKKVLELLKKEEAAALAKYSLPTLLTIYQKVCDAMAFAHSKGVIHRDLKPENIMIGAYGEVLVMDWGLAKLLRRRETPEFAPARPLVEVESCRSERGDGYATMEGAVMGTPAYMAPEQARGELDRLDQRTDIFSLGLILYEMLTLTRPFAGRTAQEILKAVVSGRPPRRPDEVKPPAYLGAEPVPPSLSAVAMRALEHRPEHRYQELALLQADLAAYQNGFATRAERASLWRHAKLLIKRHQAAAAGIAAVLLVGLSFGTKALVEGRRAEREAERARRGEAAAQALLADLRRTAPVFYEQAKTSRDLGKLEEALERIGYAADLDETNADYHLFRADLRESSQDLASAMKDYREVLRLRPGDVHAQVNLALCERLLKENNGHGLGKAQQVQLLSALREQKRLVESVPLAAAIDPDLAATKAAILARLGEVRKQPGWTDTKVASLPDGTFKIDLSRLGLRDYSLLKGLPVSTLLLNDTEIVNPGSLAALALTELDLHATKLSDLEPLRGMPLRKLNLGWTKVADLSPLAGMKLEWLEFPWCKVDDLRPLAGMPLHFLECRGNEQLSDLSSVRGAPLEEVSINRTRISDLSPIASTKLKRLNLSESSVTDLSPLIACVNLEELSINNSRTVDLRPLARLKLQVFDGATSKLVDIAALRGHPLRVVRLNKSDVHDLGPLAECVTLEEISLPEGAGDVSMLRKLPRLRAISYRFDTANRPTQNAADFWKEYDARKAGTP